MDKLQGTDATKSQDFVLKTQTVAADSGFKHVSKKWYDKCISYDVGLKKMAEDRANTEDIKCSLMEIIPHVENDKFCLMHLKTGKMFKPTEYAMEQLGNWIGAGTLYPNKLYGGDKGDADTLRYITMNGWRKLGVDKQFLFRTRKDGTLRAMLSSQYLEVDNEWFIESLKKIIPGGMLSHWKGDSDTVYGNVLIPDTIRAETDSDYGGMLSISNCEIGSRRLSTSPSIFRAICMNGCIWGQTKGETFERRHRGKLDMVDLFKRIKENLMIQIPLLPQGIEKLLGTRSLGWDGAEMKPLFAQVAIDHNFSKVQARSVMKTWGEAESENRNMFGVINSITRYGQTQSNSAWVEMDQIAGNLTKYGSKPDMWDSLTSRAKSLTVKQVDDVFERVSN